MKYERELSVAIAAVRAAATICQRVQSQITNEIVEKKDRSPVTVADFASQAVICQRLANAFSADTVIAEEDSAELQTATEAIRGQVLNEVVQVLPDATEALVYEAIDHGFQRQASSRFWTLDPIDGTKGFIRGEQYAIALALIENGEIQLGVLGCPNLLLNNSPGSLLTAIRGEGAFVRPLENSDEQPIRISVTATTDSSQARFCESVEAGHSKHSDAARIAQQLKISSEPVRLDSQAKYAVVAQGQADIYMRLPTRAGYREKIWDHAAGALNVTEAGGRVSDIHGNELDFSAGHELREGGGVLATNGHLHQATVDAVQGL